MESIITKHLEKMTLKPRNDDFFIKAVEELTNEKIKNPKIARVKVREIVSNGQVKAKNDNLKGLQNQVKEEKITQIGRGFIINDEIKGILFKTDFYDIQKAERYLDKKNIKYGRPKQISNALIFPLHKIHKNDRFILIPITKYIKAMRILPKMDKKMNPFD